MRKHPLHKEYFIFLLPLFFVLHGYVENFPAVPAAGAAKLWLKYTAGAVVLTGLTYLAYKNFRKAALLSFVLLFIYFFFGPVQDLVNKNFEGAFITRYSFILPALTIIVVTAIIFFKKNRFALNQQVKFLNILLLLLIVLEFIFLSTKIYSRQSSREKIAVQVCDTCSKPDIYLILADEYAGHKPLQDQFGFDNSAFENALRQRGFSISKNSKSNYNFTVYSMASMFNMDYLQHVNNIATDKESLNTAYNTINDNKTVQLLKAHGYSIKNYSYFGFAGEPALTTQSLLVNKEGLISSQTLYSRLMKDLGYHLVTTLKIKAIGRWMTYVDYNNNQLLLKKLKEEIATESEEPRFVYSHMMLPHYPYYQDENGNLNPMDSVKEGTQGKMHLYLGYLKYANKVYLSVIDQIQKQAKKPAVIIFMSDHGFREYPEDVPREYQFMNINAVYGVATDSFFNNGMSSVNQFRFLFNDLFQQNNPPLKDSSIFQEKF